MAQGDALIINGGRPLRGTVRLSGSKNGALPVLAATLLMDGEVVLYNVPLIEDVYTMVDLLRALGLRAEIKPSGVVIVRSRGPESSLAPLELVQRMRASFYVAGPLLARLGRAEVPLPGGCKIGTRPIDYVVDALGTLGVEAEVDHGYVRARAGRLRGGTVYLDARYRSPGATFNVAMAACLAEGTTIIENASGDPEVVNFCEFLNAMGARISGAGSNRLAIEGVRSLEGCAHRVVADRIEAGTYLLAAAVTGGTLTVEEIDPSSLDFVIAVLREAGMDVETLDRSVRLRARRRPRAVDVTTGPYPLFPTDLQPPMVVLMALADGTSTVEETIYDGRLAYVDELRRMGARVRILDQAAVVTGVKRLTGAKVSARDMRAGAALTLAALAAEGESEITGRHFILRGYERLEQKLTALGARITAADGDATVEGESAEAVVPR
jgi:UDP-N-acetylglucosamine 1-carboxyvinyltransferase